MGNTKNSNSKQASPPSKKDSSAQRRPSTTPGAKTAPQQTEMSPAAKLREILGEDQPTKMSVDEVVTTHKIRHVCTPLGSPEGPEWWAVYAHPKDEVEIFKHLKGAAPSVYRSEGSAYISIAVFRHMVHNAADWAAIEAKAMLIVDCNKTVSDITKPGTLLVWPERTRVEGKWATAQRWAGQSALLDIATHMIAVAPNCKLGIDREHGKPVLVVQVEGAELATVLSRARMDDLQMVLFTPSTMDTMFLELTTQNERTASLLFLEIEARKALSEKYPGIVWIASSMPRGMRSIAMFPGSFVEGDAMSYEKHGVQVRFFAEKASSASVAAGRAVNKKLVEGMTKQVTAELVSQGRAIYGADYPDDIKTTREPGGMGEDEDIDAQVRAASAKDVYAHVSRTSAATQKLLTKLTSMNVGEAGREAAAALVAKAMPSEEALAETWASNLAKISAPTEVLALADSTNPDIAQACSNYEAALRAAITRAQAKSFTPVPPRKAQVTYAAPINKRTMIRGDVEILRRGPKKRKS